MNFVKPTRAYTAVYGNFFKAGTLRGAAPIIGV